MPFDRASGQRLWTRVRLRLLRRLLRSRAPGALDVFYAYRLLLLRSPDDDGWSHFLGAARAGTLSLEALSQSLLTSEEFASVRTVPGDRADYDSKPIEEQIVKIHDFEMLIDRHDLVIGRAISQGEYEPACTAIIRQHVAPGHTFVDVGANVGFFTLLAAGRVGPTGHVLAFEPIVHNYRLLEKSIALNELANVQLHRTALLDRSGCVEFLQWERRNSGSFHLLNDASWDRARYSVEAAAFDELFTGQRLDFVKIDVEGAEGLVLDGMREAIRRHRPIILFEYSPTAIADLSRRDPAQVLQGLHALGYSTVEVQEYLRGRRTTSASQMARLIRRRALNHLDLLAIPSGH